MSKKILCFIMIVGLVFSAVFASTSNRTGGVVTIKDELSPTGFTTTFTYVDPEATNVEINGGFMFYEKGNPMLFADGYYVSKLSGTMAETFVTPDSWDGLDHYSHVLDNGYIMPLTNDGNGVWSLSVQLPCASYLYQYNVSYDGGETWKTIADPCNLPNVYGNKLPEQSRSEFYVPYDQEKQGVDDDWTWLSELEDETLRGSVELRTYKGVDGDARPLLVYLPAGYDENRAEPYKILYMIEGDSGDWFQQGRIHNIADRLIASGDVEPFVIMMMSVGSYTKGEYVISDKFFTDLEEYMLPFSQENYNIVTDSEGRALAGLSRQSLVTTLAYYRNPSLFSSYCILSGGYATDFPELPDYREMAEPELFIGAGYADKALVRNSVNKVTDTSVYVGINSVIGFMNKLDAAGIEFNNGDSPIIVQGGHDWFVWQQLIKIYFEDYLWK